MSVYAPTSLDLCPDAGTLGPKRRAQKKHSSPVTSQERVLQGPTSPGDLGPLRTQGKSWQQGLEGPHKGLQRKPVLEAGHMWPSQ
jgi:hypothetical protein